MNDTVAKQLIGTDVWRPGERVEFVRPAISRTFVASSAIACGFLAGLAVFLLQQNASRPDMEISSRALGVVGFGVVGASGVVAFLQGSWPSRRIVLDWTSRRLEVAVGRKTSQPPFELISRILLRAAPSQAQLDLVVAENFVRVFDSDDHGRASFSLPLGQLELLAEDLSRALDVPLLREEACPEPAPSVWKNAPWPGRIAVLVAGASILLYGFDVVNKTVAFLGVGASALGVVWSVMLSAKTSEHAASEELRTLGGFGAVAALGSLFALLAGLLSLFAPLTTAGVIVAALFLTFYLPLCLLVPDMVCAQRAGLTVSMLTLLRQRLRGIPVRSLVRACTAMREQGRHCSLTTAERVYVDAGGRNSEALTMSIQDAGDRGDVELPTRVEGGFVQNVSQTGGVRGLGYHLQMLFWALAGIAIAGFFFVVTSGPVYLDILFIPRDWRVTDAEITNFSHGGRNRSPRFTFTYKVDGKPCTATCFGPISLNQNTDPQARFDANEPGVAVLVGGWRADSLLLLPTLLFGVALLVVLPLPILLGHLVADCFSLLFGSSI